MRKYLFLYLLISFACSAVAQRKPKPTIVDLIRSDRAEGVRIKGEDVIKVYQGMFKQEGTTLTSDSAYYYQARNSFDAFGNVHINQGDTLNVYGDKLYYNGNTHVALVTDNVRMVDRDATLTTNYLTYNTATRIGTYTGGGKLVNKDNTLVSKNGYYFANSRDAYFRYDVVLTTVDAIIKTDTLRYNSGSRISYFYGPTKILGKDKDTLYTERGNYNTITEQAFFSKNNLYSSGSKSLKGDSLFYDRLKGYGRAVKRVTFNDNEQKVTIKGDLGTFYKAEEKCVVTENPYAIIITEQRDSTKSDSATVQPADIKAKKDNTKVASKVPPVKAKLKPTTARSNAKATDAAAKTDTAAVLPPPKVKRDTIYWGADTLETRIMTYKSLRELQEKMRQAGIRDTSLKDTGKVVVKRKPIPLSTAKNLIQPPPADFKMDMSFLRPNYFGKPKPVDTLQKKKQAMARAAADSAKKKAAPAKPKIIKTDSVYLANKLNLSDTARIRVMSAHHNAKIFKSDLQAKSDSMFYSYADSTMRCFVNPMFWTQGSQISGDTIYLQLKNKKLDNMNVFPTAFTVNIEGTDSTNFNQVAGKRMRGFFVENKFQRLFVDGNAETIYYNRDSLKNVTELLRTISSRIRVNFKDNSATDVMWYTKVDERGIPIKKAKEDEKILKGFIWKPKDRPASKEVITSPAVRKKAAQARKVATKPTKSTGKPAAKPGQKPSASKPAATTVPAAGDSIKVSSPAGGIAPALKDSSKVKPAADTLKKAAPVETTKKKP